VYVKCFFFQNVKWDGLEEVSLFQRPKANVLISVSGMPQGQLEIPYKFRYKTNEVQYSGTSELVEPT